MMKSCGWTGKYSTAEQTSAGRKVSAHFDATSSQAATGNDPRLLHAVDGKKLSVKSPGGVVPMADATSAVPNPR
jgi:hypothetical protein